MLHYAEQSLIKPNKRPSFIHIFQADLSWESNDIQVVSIQNTNTVQFCIFLSPIIDLLSAIRF